MSSNVKDGMDPGVHGASVGSMRYVVLLASVAALGGLLFGYDTAVIAGAVGFLQDYFQLDPQYATGWAAASALIGCALGAALAGLLSDQLGRKKMLIIAAVLFFVSAVGTAVPAHFHVFIFFRVIGGLAIGAASIASPMYIAEISPARVRGRMVSVNQLAIVTGMLVVYFVNFFIAGYGFIIDAQTVADRTAGRAIPLDPQIVREFVAKVAPKADAKAVDAMIVAQGASLQSQRVVEFLDKSNVNVHPTAIELAHLQLRSWNAESGWRWMFGSGALPSVLLLVLLLVVPESPRWLTKQGRGDEALAVLSRVSGPVAARLELADIEDTIAHESGSVVQLFQPGLRRVLVIGVTLAVLQQVTGINVFLYFATEIFKKMGAGTSAALLQTVLVGVVNLVFTVVAIWTVDRLGRKPLMLIGFVGMGISLFAMGWVAYAESTAVWVLLFILSYIACFALSVGPVTWVILSEIFPTRLRGRAMAIATVCLWVANSIVTQTFTIMDESPWLVAKFNHAFPFWVYCGLCVVSVLFVWRTVPETKGRTLEEIERSWLS